MSRRVPRCRIGVVVLIMSIVAGSQVALADSLKHDTAVRWGSTGIDSAQALAVDTVGNVYITGYFTGTVDFDPGVGTTESTSNGNTDIFVSKFDANDAFVWVQTFGSTDADEGLDIAVDPSGNVLVTGYFMETVDFDPGGATKELTAVNDDDGFVLKLDSDGDLVWVAPIGGAGNDKGLGIAVNEDGVVCIVGYFSYTVDFDPDPVDTYSLSSAMGSFDAFVTVLNAGGDFQWGHAFGDDIYDQANDVAIDSTGAVLVAGNFESGTIDFDPGPGVAELSGNYDAFLLKLASDGGFVWVRGWGAGGLETAGGLAIAEDDSVHVTGLFAGTNDFDPGAGVAELSSVANTFDVYISKFDADGDFAWVRHVVAGSADEDQGTDLLIDEHGRLITVGRFGDTADFDPGSGTYELTVPGVVDATDAFVSIIDSEGDFLWAGSFGGTAPAGNRPDAALAVGTHDGRLVIAGEFSETPDFDMGSGLFELTSAGGSDTFVFWAIPTAVLRYGGANRYGTAAAISKADFPDADAVDTAFVAFGGNFPDALAGAAVAAKLGAPLLLVQADSIPAETVAELTRLGPSTIVVLGGTAVISEGVETALEGYASTVKRVAGGNRYATSVEISKYGFPGNADTVIVATGAGFPDALAGGPAAKALNAPVLLTDPNDLPDIVSEEIERLAPSRVLVVGGGAVVSEAVVTELEGLVADVDRISGANRYATSVAISEEAFAAGSDRVYIATGLNFPDALAGAAAAGVWGAPVLLVPGTSVPAEVEAEINRLGATIVVVLGGTGVVSAGVESKLAQIVDS